jgi:hypothetical protein
MSRARRAWFCLGVVALAALLPAGCRRTLTLPTPHPIKGRLTWHGEPLRYVIVNLEPADGRGAEADGMTGEDGTFELRSFANDGKMDGVVPDKYRVSLENYDPVRMVTKRLPPPQTRPSALPAEEWDPHVTIEVQEEDNDLDIAIP